ncbi:DUF2782 domain-containing protein [Neisseria sp. Ec49-e6-T10]|uniref:DUF2782 domain-containing protein n=1 Tax=Neisseria sp. Ec49-e6-T10 TaxID=3140744 RepID=UPI003EB9C7E7
MKAIIAPLCLLYGIAFAAPDINVPPPPSVTESDLNLTAKELEDIQKKQPNQLNKSAEQSKTEPKNSGDATNEVRVIKLGDDTIEEFRNNGQVYKIRVTPKIGKPYYIQPKNADNPMSDQRTNPTSNWNLFSF